MEINKKMTVDEIINIDRSLANVLMASGMHCLGCAMASGESLEQACAVHEIDCDELVQRINEHLSSKWGA